jgi:hypothetical protein
MDGMTHQELFGEDFDVEKCFGSLLHWYDAWTHCINPHDH